MTIEQEELQSQQNQQQANEPSPAEVAAKAKANEEMEAAAAEASKMLLDRVMKESRGEDPNVETEEDKAAKAKAEADSKAASEKKTKDDAAKKKLKDAAQSETKQDQKPSEEVKQDDKPAVRVRRNVVSPEKLAETAASAAARAATEAIRAAEQDRAKAEADRAAAAAREKSFVPKELESEVEKLREAQKQFPDAYRGRDIAAEFVASAQKEKAYEKEWKKKNPGRELNWEDEEHADFVASNAVDVDADHLKAAENAIMREQVIREAEERVAKKYGSEIEEVRRMRAEAAIAPIRKQVDEAASLSLLEAVRPDLVDTFSKDRAKVIEELTADPIAAEVVQQVEAWSMPALDAAVRVIHNPTGYSDKSPEVKTLVEAALRVDKVLTSVPSDQRPTTEDGRRFASLKDYAQMPAARRAGYYTVQDENLVAQLIVKAAQWEASQLREVAEKRAEAYAKRLGFVKQEASKESKTSPTTPQKEERKAAPSVRTPVTDSSAKKEDDADKYGLPKQFWNDIGL